MAREASGRVKRNPIKDGYRNRLSVKGKEPGFEYRIVNDLDDRITTLQERGWELVQDKSVQIGDKRVASPTAEGSPVTVSVGGGITGYLMKIKKEWYDEDTKAKQAYNDQLEQSTQLTDEQRRDGFYGKVSIDRS